MHRVPLGETDIDKIPVESLDIGTGNHSECTRKLFSSGGNSVVDLMSFYKAKTASVEKA